MKCWQLRLIPIVLAGLFILFKFVSSEKFVNLETGRVARVKA